MIFCEEGLVLFVWDDLDMTHLIGKSFVYDLFYGYSFGIKQSSHVSVVM